MSDKDQGTANGFIQLSSGLMFNPLQPNTQKLTIQDIAHGLANQVRFGGQIRSIKNFYSVSEHSVLVSLMLEDWGFDRMIQYAGLMHDCEEGLGLPDLPRPVKVYMPAYKEAGLKLQQAVFEKFDIPFPYHDAVHLADNSALFLYERPRLMDKINDEYWQYDGELRESTARNIMCHAPEQALYHFMVRYNYLMRKLGRDGG